MKFDLDTLTINRAAKIYVVLHMSEQWDAASDLHWIAVQKFGFEEFSAEIRKIDVRAIIEA